MGGRYRLDELLGRGGMSEVWRAHDTVLSRPVAVKILAGAQTTNPAYRLTILTEAQAAAGISHPHVTAVYDYGEAPDAGGERVPYVVMELLRGESLAQRLAHGPLDAPAGLRLCAQVAGALAAAHDDGLVHRDIKPSNIMITTAGAKVFDFGIAAPTGQSDPDPTSPILGTAAYLAPERLAGATVTPASDVYALGVLLFRTLTNRLPWSVHTVSEMLVAHVYAEPIDLPDVTGVPASVRELIRRCLAKDADDRPTAREAAVILAAAAGIRPPLGEDDAGGPVPAPAGGGRRVLLFAAAVLGTAAITGLVAVRLLTPDDGVQPASAATVPGAVVTTDKAGEVTVVGTSLATPVVAMPGGVGGGLQPTAGPDGVATTQPPAPTPSPTPPGPPPPQWTFNIAEGSVVATCEGTLAKVVALSPVAPYTWTGNWGPASTVTIVLHRTGISVRIALTCSDGTPTARVTTSGATSPPGGGGPPPAKA